MGDNIRENNNRTWKTLGVIAECLLMLSLAGLLFFIIYQNHNYQSPNNEFLSRKVDTIDSGWERVLESGERIPVSFPCDFKEEPGTPVIFETTLPMDIESHDWLALRIIHQNLNIYVDGELRDSYFQDEDGVFRAGIASVDKYAQLYESDCGKVLKLEFFKEGSSSRDYREVFYGQKAGLQSHYLKMDGPSFIIGIIFGVLGFFCVLFGFAIRIVTKGNARIDYIGWSLLLIFIWNFTQSEFRDVIFANIKGISIVPSISLLLFPVPLALYFNNITGKRFKKLFYPYVLTIFAFEIVATVLQYLKITDFYDLVSVVFVFLYSLLVCMFVCILVDRKKGLLKDYYLIFYGLLGMALTGVGQVYTFINKTSNSSAISMCLGVFIFVVFAIIQAIISVMNINTEKQAALKTAEMKTQFLANMSHEIRTPINAVLGMNEAILRESKEENIIGYASDVDHAGHLLLSLINDILDLSKLDSGKMNLVFSEYNLRTLLISTVNLIEKRVSDKNLTLKLDIDKTLPLKLLGDEVRIQQIVTNILTNAVKYTEKGSITLKVFGEKQDNNLSLSIHVIDTGMGIKDEDKAKLFSAFTRLDEKKNQKVEGTGLGLAITFSLVKLMGGEIIFDSVYGEGSTVKINVPQQIVGEETIGDITIDNCTEHSEKKATNDLFKATGCRILVVDDVLVNLKVVTSLLKKTGLAIDTTPSPFKCLEMVKETKYDIILLDHMMPEKDGIEVFKEMKTYGDYINANTPVIMLTANAIMGAKEEYMSFGFSDYVSKPFSAGNLQTTLLKYLPKEKVEIL